MSSPPIGDVPLSFKAPFLFELELAKGITSARVWPGVVGSRLNSQVVSQRRHGKGAAGLCTGFERLRDGIADEFLHCLFHGTCSERLVNTAPDKELECLLGDRKIETLLSKSGEFLGNGEAGQFRVACPAKAV